MTLANGIVWHDTETVKAYFSRGNEYLRCDTESFAPDPGYPKPLAVAWTGLPGTGFEDGVHTALDLGEGFLYLFLGSQYLKIRHSDNTVVQEAREIGEAWGLGQREGRQDFVDTGFAEGVDAAVNWGNGKAYFFRGGTYVQYDIASDTIDVIDGEQVRPLDPDWPGFADAGLAEGIHTGVNWGDGSAYFFLNDFFARYTIGSGIDEGYPSTIADGWSALAEAGFDGGISAAWVKLEAGVTPLPDHTTTGALQPGDHVWYHDGRVSTDKNIPNSAWFGTAAGTTDYGGHGSEIFHFVIHGGGAIFRGRPHMRNFEGSFGWLNNNPGNLTGVTGGPDYGQYPGKFNWHNFLVFPSHGAGFDAIGKFLRGAGYRDLNMTQAFEKYAPASDGNDPVRYAQEAAAAAGVPVTTRVGDLDDAQMLAMQNKIEAIEGSRPGVVLTKDSPELPDAVRQMLS